MSTSATPPATGMDVPDVAADPIGGMRLRWLVPVLLLLGVLTIYVGTAARSDMHIDAHAAAVEAWHIAATGSPWLEGDLTEQMRSNKFIGEAANGHVVGLRMAGPVLVQVPAYWMMNRDPTPSAFQFWPAGMTAAVLVSFAVLFLFLALRQYLSATYSLIASLAFALATPTWTVSADQVWTHTISQLGLAGAALAAARERWWWAGASLGLAMLGRPHLAIVAAALGIGISISQRRWGPMVNVAVPTLSVLAFLSAWNRWMFGLWSLGAGGYGGKTGAAAGGFDVGSEASSRVVASVDHLPPALANYLGFLASFDRGLLVWTPAILVLLPALWRSWPSLPAWSRYLLLGGVLYTVVQLRVNAFPGGDGFWGYRYGLELLTCAAPALALSAAGMGRIARAALPAVLAIQFGALTIGAIDQGFFVRVEQVWTDNSFWLALRHQPAVVGTWMALCVGVALAGTAIAARRQNSSPQ